MTSPFTSPSAGRRTCAVTTFLPTRWPLSGPTLEAQTRNEGKPEQALPKIVEGKLNGWYKRVPGGVLLEQPYAKDDKQSVAQVLGDAKVVRVAQAVVGG